MTRVAFLHRDGVAIASEVGFDFGAIALIISYDHNVLLAAHTNSLPPVRFGVSNRSMGPPSFLDWSWMALSRGCGLAHSAQTRPGYFQTADHSRLSTTTRSSFPAQIAEAWALIRAIPRKLIFSVAFPCHCPVTVAYRAFFSRGSFVNSALITPMIDALALDQFVIFVFSPHHDGVDAGGACPPPSAAPDW